MHTNKPKLVMNKLMWTLCSADLKHHLKRTMVCCTIKQLVCVSVQMSSTSEHTEIKTLKLKVLHAVISHLKCHLKTNQTQTTNKLDSKST